MLKDSFLDYTSQSAFITPVPQTFKASTNVRAWNRYSQIKTVCRTTAWMQEVAQRRMQLPRDAAIERPWMADFACLDLAIPVPCPGCSA